MKILISLLFFSTVLHARTLDTTCKDIDCFRNGWSSVGSDEFKLDCGCKEHDCKKYGWLATDSDGSLYDIDCKPGGCFREGWHSAQMLNGTPLYDDVTCTRNDCLKYGWVIESSQYPNGKAFCSNDDCARYGGLMYWRGELWKTTCKNERCYLFGWVSEIN